MPPTGVLIAVVDDEESVRKALGRLIGSAGFDVLTFASGVEFLSAARELSPQCVVLDVRMPHMDGFELQQALLRGDRPVPVVVITGDDSPECRARALRHGARAYLRKPVDGAQLLEAIQSALCPLPTHD